MTKLEHNSQHNKKPHEDNSSQGFNNRLTPVSFIQLFELSDF
jgi:hypothetical protein